MSVNRSLKKLFENAKLQGIARMYDGGAACHLAYEECHFALLECRSALLKCQIALDHATMLMPWWANSSRFSNARFAFSSFLKDFYFVCDHETLS